MSYSFSVKGSNKEAAKAAVAAKFDEIVAQQPCHETDRAAVIANANNVIDTLADDETKDVSVSCNGYICWNGTGDNGELLFTSAAISASAGYANRE